MQFRTIARLIGIIDMILSIIIALLVTISLFILAYASATTSNMNTSDTKQAVGLFLVLAWFVMIMSVLICFLQIYASWKLIEGTDQFVSAVNGLRACRIWRGVTIFFLIFHILIVISWISGLRDISEGLPTLFFILLRVVALCLVQEHMSQLYRTLPTTHNNVTVINTAPNTTYRLGVVETAPPAYTNTVPASKY